MTDAGTALTVQPGYHNPLNAYLRPERVVVMTRYFIANWMPRLGTDRTGLVIVLRQHALEAVEDEALQEDGTGSVSLSSGELGAQLGMTEKQVQALLVSEPISKRNPWRQLKVPKRGKYKQYVTDQVLALRHFIPRMRYAYDTDPASGKPRRVGYVIEIALDDPLTPEDLARVKAKFGVDAPGVNAEIGLNEGLRKPQNPLSRPVNANIGAVTYGNLSVTRAGALGSAAPSRSGTAVPPTPSPSPRGAVDAPSKGEGHRVPAAAEPAEDGRPSSCRAPKDPPPSNQRTVDLDLPLPQLKELALGDLRRQRKRSSKVSIVTQFVARLTGLGRDELGSLRTQPERADYARVGQLCKAFGFEPVLRQAFAVAGRMPDEVEDPLAYLRVGLEHQRRRKAQRRREARQPVAAGYGAGANIDQYTPDDYREN